VTKALELAVLAHLEKGNLICAQLARRTGASEHVVQRLLDDLVSDGLVLAKPDEHEPTSHHLTHRGAARLMRLRSFSEQQAASEWKQEAAARPPETPKQARWVWPDARAAAHTAKRARMEHAILERLERGGLTADELALRIGTSIGVLRSGLDALVAWDCVSRRHQDNLPDLYFITVAGRSRIQVVRTLLASPDGRTGQLDFVALQQLPPPSPPQPAQPRRPVDEVPRRRWRWLRRNR